MLNKSRISIVLKIWIILEQFPFTVTMDSQVLTEIHTPDRREGRSPHSMLRFVCLMDRKRFRRRGGDSLTQFITEFDRNIVQIAVGNVRAK